MVNEYDGRNYILAKAKRALALPTMVIVIVISVFVYVHLRSYIFYHGVEIGMEREALIDHLGPPRRGEQRLIFCAPYFPWTGDCVEARQGGEFLFFKFGIDRWIVAGLDSAGVVWFRTLGDI
ncbi:MAG TPA: hypothetical protein DGR97_06540 [Gammaproteobacteria bacterium]|nr:hypothetical protein [Gammaproteobacteria bacterium]